MKEFKQPTLEERRAMALKAKQAQLEAARKKAPANDPQFAERQAARLAAAEARDARIRDRKAERLAEAKRKEIAEAEAEAERVRALEAAKKAAEYPEGAKDGGAMVKALEGIMQDRETRKNKS